MKVLLLNQFFHPDFSAAAQIATDLAEDLVGGGFEVTALASRGSYLGGEKLAARDSHCGIDIIRLLATSLGKRTLFYRAVDYASFYASAASRLASLPTHDVLVVLTTPPLIAAAGLVAKALKGTRLVYWVQDLYPEIAVAFEALRAGSIAARTMAAVSGMVMRRADAVVTLGERMRELCIAAGALPQRTVVIPNWSDAAVVRPVAPEVNGLRQELANGARTVVMYSGNLGRGHDVATLIGAVRILRDWHDISFVFIGEGSGRREVEVAACELPNLRLFPYQPRDRLSESLSAGDVHLISLLPEVEGLIEPSKLYGIMAAGRPALFVGPPGSEVARTIERERCGRVFRNGDAEGLAAAIRDLAANSAEREVLGQRARSALQQRYSRSVATARFRELLLSLAEKSSHLNSTR
jgi:glycosyltransferase involved in cell wall biosynthesis